MKNIHIISTDKPSRLYYADEKLYLHKDCIERINYQVNIYITSYNADINENDYIITKDGRLVEVSYLLSKDLEGASKIILTTDQDLNGVQAIDDEFLEWFVKNPSCEEVEVEDVYKTFLEGDKRSVSNFRNRYKIIIPKEEPNIIDKWLQENSNPEIAKQVEEEAKELCEQETLEEACKRIRKELDYSEFDYTSFKLGAKWQQEQDKNRFSDEDMKQAFLDGMFCSSGDTVENSIEEWFEQFKKK